MSKLKVAVQKDGRLSEKSLHIFRECGIRVANGGRKLMAEASNFPIEFLFLRDDDIPQYVEKGVADIGVVGENIVWEQNKNVQIVKKLGFANCKMSLAIPKNLEYTGIQYFNNKKVATSFPNILQQYFDQHNIQVEIERLSGSVEIATGIELADGIFDIVSTGSTLLMNGLKEVHTVTQSEAVLISNPFLSETKKELLNRVLFRINAVMSGATNKYIMLNAPTQSIPEISKLLPGMKSPTVLPLGIEGWSSLHTVVQEDKFWEIIDELKKMGAEGILVLPIEKMIV